MIKFDKHIQDYKEIEKKKEELILRANNDRLTIEFSGDSIHIRTYSMESITIGKIDALFLQKTLNGIFEEIS